MCANRCRLEHPGSVSFKTILGSGLGLKLEPVSLSGEDIAFLQYTGGTTVLPKPLCSPTQHGGEPACRWRGSGRAASGGGRIVITALPLYHIFALTSNCLAFLPLGRNVLITNPLDFPGFVAELKKYKFTSAV